MEDHNYSIRFGIGSSIDEMETSSEEENEESQLSGNDTDKDEADPAIQSILTNTNIEALTYILRLDDNGAISIVNKVPEDAGEHSYFPVTLPISKIKSLANPFPGVKKLDYTKLKISTAPLIAQSQSTVKDTGSALVRTQPLKRKRSITRKKETVESGKFSIAENLLPGAIPNSNLEDSQKECKSEKQQKLSTVPDLPPTNQNQINIEELTSSDKTIVAVLKGKDHQEASASPRSRVRRPPSWLSDFAASPY